MIPPEVEGEGPEEGAEEAPRFTQWEGGRRGGVVKRFGKPVAEVFWDQARLQYQIRLTGSTVLQDAGKKLTPAVAKALDIYQRAHMLHEAKKW